MRMIRAYKVRNDNLPKITGMMNSSDLFFRSEVTDVIVGENASIVIVKMEGSYPFIENQWEKFIVKEDE